MFIKKIKISKKMGRNYDSIINIIRILRKLKKQEMKFFIDNLNEKNREHICEIIFNLMYNLDSFHMSKHKISKIKKLITPMKKDFISLAEKNVCDNTKKRIIKKQNGNGILTTLFGILVPSLISSFIHKK